jgi:hypothetical protein
MIDRKEFEKRLRTLGPLSRLAQSEEFGLRGGEAGGGGGLGALTEGKHRIPITKGSRMEPHRRLATVTQC